MAQLDELLYDIKEENKRGNKQTVEGINNVSNTVSLSMDDMSFSLVRKLDSLSKDVVNPLSDRLSGVEKTIRASNDVNRLEEKKEKQKEEKTEEKRHKSLINTIKDTGKAVDEKSGGLFSGLSGMLGSFGGGLGLGGLFGGGGMMGGLASGAKGFARLFKPITIILGIFRGIENAMDGESWDEYIKKFTAGAIGGVLQDFISLGKTILGWANLEFEWLNKLSEADIVQAIEGMFDSMSLALTDAIEWTVDKFGAARDKFKNSSIGSKITELYESIDRAITDATINLIRMLPDSISSRAEGFLGRLGISHSDQSDGTSDPGHVYNKNAVERFKAQEDLVEQHRENYGPEHRVTQNAINRLKEIAQEHNESEESSGTLNSRFFGSDDIRPRTPTFEPESRAPSSSSSLNERVAGIEAGVGITGDARYDQLVGGGKESQADLRNMTLAEVKELQSGMIADGHMSTAVGKYQFIASTLANLAKKAGVSDDQKFDAATQEKLMHELVQENAVRLGREGLEATPENLYLMHNLGPRAAKLIGADPDANISDILSNEEIRNNRSLYEGKTAGEALNTVSRKMDAPSVRGSSVATASRTNMLGKVNRGSRGSPVSDASSSGSNVNVVNSNSNVVNNTLSGDNVYNPDILGTALIQHSNLYPS